MKLQELLEKHKDKIWFPWIIKCHSISIDSDYLIDFEAEMEWMLYINQYSLSDLLFSTPFLSLLEWKIDASEKVWIHQYIKDERFIEWYSTYENYHKINLVLLNTDKERIKYVEAFTL